MLTVAYLDPGHLLCKRGHVTGLGNTQEDSAKSVDRRECNHHRCGLFKFFWFYIMFPVAHCTLDMGSGNEGPLVVKTDVSGAGAGGAVKRVLYEAI